VHVNCLKISGSGEDSKDVEERGVIELLELDEIISSVRYILTRDELFADLSANVIMR